jgi:predicted outer membrane protein
MKLKQLAIASFATLLVGSPLLAQEPASNPTQNPQAPTKEAKPLPGQPAKGSLSRQQQADSALTKDQIFAKCLAIANQEQVTMARFAEEKATTAEVKEFAATLGKAHENCLEQLRGISPLGGTKSNASTAIAKSEGSNSSNVDFLQLHQEISAQCVKDSEEYLGKKEGIEFDKCFVGMQIAKHAAMLSTLTVLQRHSTGKLQGLIKDGLQENTQHMEVAVKLMEQLAADDSTKLSRSSK